jgi:hypothetical protein
MTIEIAPKMHLTYPDHAFIIESAVRKDVTKKAQTQYSAGARYVC